MTIFETIISILQSAMTPAKDMIVNTIPFGIDFILLGISAIIGWYLSRSKISSFMIFIIFTILIYLFLRLI